MHGNMRTFLLMAAMTALLMGMGWMIGGQGGAVLALVFAGVGNIWAWWNSDKAVLRQHGAMPVTEAEAPELVRMVRQLADRAGLPMPRVYVLATEQPNAFATGRNPENSAVAVTQGLMRILTRDELAGVIAHELAHIRHRDTLTMTVTATMAGAIAMLGNLMLFTGDRDRPGGALGGILAMLAIGLIVLIALLVLRRARRRHETARAAAAAAQAPAQTPTEPAQASPAPARATTD